MKATDRSGGPTAEPAAVAAVPHPATPRPVLVDFLLLPLLFYVSARIGVVLSVMPEGMAILWPPNGVLLAYFIRFGPRSFVAFGLLALVAEVAVDYPKYPLVDALLFGFSNVTEVTIAALLLRRMGFDPRFKQVSDLTKFVVAAPVTGAFIGAAFGALVFRSLPDAETVYFQFLRIWWMGDALGIMIVTPLLLSLWTQTRNLPARLPAFRLGDGVLSLGAIGVVGLLLVARNGTLMGTHVGPVLLLPFAIFAGVRFGPSVAAIIVSLITVLILTLTTQGRNPFGADAPREAVIHAQEFVFVLSVMTLGLAALVSHVRASQAKVVNLNAALEQRVRDRTRELEQALTQVKELRGLLPICAWCKRVRDGDNYLSVEEYISARTDAQFSHGICPDCMAEVTSDDAMIATEHRPKRH